MKMSDHASIFRIYMKAKKIDNHINERIVDATREYLDGSTIIDYTVMRIRLNSMIENAENIEDLVSVSMLSIMRGNTDMDPDVLDECVKGLWAASDEYRTNGWIGDHIEILQNLKEKMDTMNKIYEFRVKRATRLCVDAWLRYKSVKVHHAKPHVKCINVICY